MNVGLAVNIRANIGRLPIEVLADIDRRFPDEPSVEEYDKLAYNSLMPFGVNYSFGTTLRLVSNFGIDITYERQLTNVINTPLKLEKGRQEPQLRYGLLMVRAVYFFNWHNLKGHLNK